MESSPIVIHTTDSRGHHDRIRRRIAQSRHSRSPRSPPTVSARRSWPPGRRVLDTLAAQSEGKFAFDWEEFPWGCEYYEQTGKMMADDGLDTLKAFDAIYFGAVGWRNVPDHISLWGLRLNITQNFDQWANIRPVKFLPGVVSPLRKADDTELDWVVVRENSEGEYAGLGGRNLQRPRAGQRGRPADRAVHRQGLRAHHAVRVRPGPHPHGEEGLQRHQVQRPAVRHGAVGRGVQARRPGLPRRRDRKRSRRRDEREVRPASRGPVGRRGLQPQRRHPLGPGFRAGRQPRHRGERQPEPGTSLPQHVRARPRIGPRHRRRGHQQPGRRDRQRRADAGPLRPARRGPPRRGRDRNRHRQRGSHPRHRRNVEHRRGHRRHHRRADEGPAPASPV